MHIIISPNSDGDEATVTSADVIAGKSYVHKIDAVLIPKSTLAYLDSFTDSSGKKNATVTEAFAGNTTANGTTAGNGTVKEGAAANSTSRNATATSGAAGLTVSAVLGMSVLLAAVVLL